MEASKSVLTVLRGSEGQETCSCKRARVEDEGEGEAISKLES